MGDLVQCANAESRTLKNFRLIGTVDVEPLLHAVTEHSELWDSNRVRTWHRASPHYGKPDIVLRFQDWHPGEDYFDRVLTTLGCIEYPAYAAIPEARAVIETIAAMVGAVETGRLYISRTPPGAHTPDHVDRIIPAEKRFPNRPIVCEYYDRYHVSLQSASGLLFHSGKESIFPAVGEVWWHNNLSKHSVENGSSVEWIQMALDFRIDRATDC